MVCVYTRKSLHVSYCIYMCVFYLGACLYVYVPLFTVSCLLLLLCVQSHVHVCAVITVFCQIKVIVDIIASGLPFASCFNFTFPMHALAPQPLPWELSILLFLFSQPPCFNSCPCLSPGEPSLRKRSPEGAQQDQPPAKTVVRCNLTESERSVEAVDVSRSAPVVSRGAVDAERSPPICEGELCGVSFPS